MKPEIMEEIKTWLAETVCNEEIEAWFMAEVTITCKLTQIIIYSKVVRYSFDAAWEAALNACKGTIPLQTALNIYRNVKEVKNDQ